MARLDLPHVSRNHLQPNAARAMKTSTCKRASKLHARTHARTIQTRGTVRRQKHKHLLTATCFSFSLGVRVEAEHVMDVVRKRRGFGGLLGVLESFDGIVLKTIFLIFFIKI